jgi:hypothetical protein
MIGLLLRCYPARWRAKYGEEFAAMLAERPLGPFDVADVLLGALDAQLHLRGVGSADASTRRSEVSSRIGGWAAIAGGILWLLVFFMSVTVSEAGAVGMALLLIATAVLLVALTGLSAFQARRYPRLVWAAFLLPAVGAIVSIVGVVGMATVGDRPYLGAQSAWEVWIVGVAGMLIGSGLFAIATWRVNALPRIGALILAAGAVTVVPVLAGVSGGFVSDDAGRGLSVLAMMGFGGGWILLGIGAIRGRRPVLATPDGPGHG